MSVAVKGSTKDLCDGHVLYLDSGGGHISQYTKRSHKAYTGSLYYFLKIHVNLQLSQDKKMFKMQRKKKINEV